MCLAGELIHSEEANLDILTQPIPHKTTGRIGDKHQTWEHGALLPIHVTLRDFVARGLGDTTQKGTAKHVWSFICDELEQAALGRFKDVLYKELLDNQCILLLDGLDEVPEGNKRRAQIKDVIEDFAKTFFKCRIVVTSRTYAYQNQEWRLQDFHDSVLASFNKGQIRHFIERWYKHIAILRGIKQEDAKGRAEILKTAVFRSDRLFSLAERPLLLTLMASLHAWRGGSLPEKREELYSDAVNLLLDWWESPKVVRDSAGKAIVLHPSLVCGAKLMRSDEV
jgi:predicted NACHT family NTPase